MSNQTLLEKEKQLIITRLKSGSQSRRLSVMTETGTKTFTIKQLVESIESDDLFGRTYVQDQMDFMRRLANGDVYKLINDIQNME